MIEASSKLFMLMFFNFRCACHNQLNWQTKTKKFTFSSHFFNCRFRKKLYLYFLFSWQSNKKWLTGFRCNLIFKNILSQSTIRVQMWQLAVSHTTHDALTHELAFKKSEYSLNKNHIFCADFIFFPILLKLSRIQSYMFASTAALLLDLGAVHATQNNFMGDIST